MTRKLKHEQTREAREAAGEFADDPMLEEFPTMVQIRSGALFLLAFLALCYTLYFARAILFPVFLAIMLCLLLRPPVRWLAKRGMWNFAAAALVILLAVSVSVAGIMQLWEPANHWMATAPQRFSEVERKLRSLGQTLEDINKATRSVEKIAASDNPAAVKVEVQQTKLAATLFGFTGSFLANAALTIVMLYFLLASGDAYLRKIVETIPTFRGKRGAVELFHEIEAGISAYLFTVTAINIALGLAIGVAMWLIGLPNPALWGVMAAVFNFVPYLGAALGTAIVTLVAVLEFDSLSQAAIVPVVYFGVTSLEGQIITPTILGRSMSMNPFLILLSLVFWGWIWGIGGALLAVPLLATGKMFCDRFEKLQPLGNFLGG